MPQNDNRKDQRILWLLNHSTLRESEIPMLMSFGLEVYAPKRFPRDAGNRSASVTFEFDTTLSIPKEALAILNAFNFYTDPFTPDIRRIINDYFGTAIVAYMFPMFDNMVTYFSNRILLRAFGLTSTTTYYDFARAVSAPGFRRRISAIGDRFWFAQAYPNLSAIEPSFMQERTLNLPIGLPPRVIAKSNTWVGGSKTLLFVCPDINTFSESAAIYKEFKKNFGHLPHIICGAQTIPVRGDPSVVGRLNEAEYARVYRECSAMFYHSTLERHLHYHPVEAVCYGMPLVFMRKGMLGVLGGRELPGACSTVKEARDKIEQLLSGQNPTLARRITSTQGVLLQHFSQGNNEKKWTQNFKNVVLSRAIPRPNTIRRIGILALDGSLTTATNAITVANKLARLAKTAGHNTRCMIGLPLPATHWPQCEIDEDVPAREIKWLPLMTNSSARIAQRMLGFSSPLFHGHYYLPEDGSSHFMECDSLVFVGEDPGFHPAPLKPYAVYIPSDHNPKKKTFKSTDDSFAQLIQSAMAVAVNDATASRRAIGKYGVRPEMLVNFEDSLNGIDALWQALRDAP